MGIKTIYIPLPLVSSFLEKKTRNMLATFVWYIISSLLLVFGLSHDMYSHEKNGTRLQVLNVEC